MRTIEMLKTKWYLVEMFTAKKQFRITVRKPLETKTDASRFENSRVKAHNYNSICKLIANGYVNLDEVCQANTPVVKEVTPQVKEMPQNDVEKAIADYAQKKAKSDAVKAFLTPVKQAEVKAFDYTKSLAKYERTGRGRAIKALEKQRESYCGM